MSGLSSIYLVHQSLPGWLRLVAVRGGTRSYYHLTPQICNKCCMAFTVNSESRRFWRSSFKSINNGSPPPLWGFNNGSPPPLWGYYRRSSSIPPPMMDPDIERLQRSMQGMRTSKAEKFDGDRLIYQVKGANYLHFVTLSFYATALFGLYMAPDFIVGAWESDVLDADTVVNLLMLFTGVVVLPMLLRLFASRLVFKLYHNEAKDTYVAIVSRTIFGVTKKRFRGRDVLGTHENSIERVFRLTSFKVNGRRLFVNATLFKLPSDYNKLMGMI